MDPGAARRALKAIRFISSSSLLDRLGLRNTLNKIIFNATKLNYRFSSKITSSRKQPKQQDSKADHCRRRASLFDLSLSEEQTLITETMHKFGVDSIRGEYANTANENAAIDKDLFTKFADLGLVEYAVPESHGGLASDQHDTVSQMLIHQTLASADMGTSIALLSTIGVVNTINRWGTEQQKQKLLAVLLDTAQQPKAAIAVHEPNASFDCFSLATRAEKKSKYYLLNGVKTLVPIAQYADFFIVAAQLKDNQPAMFWIPKDSPGLSVEAASFMGVKAASMAKLKLKNVKVDSSLLIGESSHVVRNYQQFISYSKLAWCAQAVGVCDAIRDYVIEYCNTRQAFGEPISHRQSVAFKIADIAIEIEAMRILMQRAVARAEQGLDFQREAYLAKLLCAEKSMQIATDGVQLLGGHGFTKEHPVERWYRDLRIVAVSETGLML